MYHCHIHFYLAGRCAAIFEMIKGMSPLAHFTHEFLESEELKTTPAAKADVILACVADLKEGEADRSLTELIAAKAEKAKLIVLAAQEQVPAILGRVAETADADLWIMPMTVEEAAFRFLRWQQNCKTEKDFWETDHFLEAAINNTPDLVWYKDKDGIHEKVNDMFCRTVNKTKEQVQGRGHAYIWDVEQDDPACIESEREVMSKRQTCVAEETIQTGEGIRQLTTYKSPLYDLDGSVMGTVGVALDVTRERAYEQEIINKNHTLETIFTTLDCGVMRHSLDGQRVFSANRAALKILGYETLEEMIQDGFNMVAASVLDEDKDKLRGCIRSLKKEGDSIPVEYRVLHRDGELLHIMGNVKLLIENGELICQRFLLDCTAQKLQEKKKEKRHKDLIRALSVDYSLVCSFDLDTGLGYILQANDPEDSLFGVILSEKITLKDSLDYYIENFVCEEDKEMLRGAVSVDRLGEELAEKKRLCVNYRIRREGRINYFQMKVVQAGAWKESHGIVMGLRSVDEEIRNEMEKKSLLEDALMQANKASRAKSAFLSNMSHDIRTPMNAIVGFSTLALAHIDQKDRVEEYIKKIIASGNHLLNLINDVLDMSRIESGKLTLEEKPCCLADILQGVENIILPDARAKHLTLSMDMCGVWHTDIYCDVLRLNQVLLNLLSNAVKYTNPGGKVSICLSEKDSQTPGCGEFEFCIRDTGMGMSEGFVAHIFEPFEREKNSTISRIQGTGLGMAITKNIVDRMNGSIEVKSKEGVGSEFIVCFPFRLCLDTAEKRDEERSSGVNIQALNGGRPERGLPANFRAGRILLAEDNELNQEIAVEILGDAGFSTDVAENGQIAVDMLRRSNPGYYQLVLMDIQMPVLNGYEAAKQIRKLENPGLSSVPILAMTANAFDEDRKMALRSGMNGHIAKPIDLNLLFSALKELLGGN